MMASNIHKWVNFPKHTSNNNKLDVTPPWPVICNVGFSWHFTVWFQIATN